MNLLKSIIGCLILASFFVACQQATETEVSTEKTEKTDTSDAENWEAKMYEPSDLVKIMRKMYDDNLVLKEKLMNGEMPGEMPAEYATIKTATATNPDDLKLSFYAMADTYLSNYKEMTEADAGSVIKKYNNLISTCLACHQNYCLGPIPKIEKLVIK